MLRSDRTGQREVLNRAAVPPAGPSHKLPKATGRKVKTPKKRKSMWSRLAKEAFEAIEDILD